MICSNPRCKKKRIDNEKNGSFNFGFENIRLCSPCYDEWQRVKLMHFRNWLRDDVKDLEQRGLSAAKQAGIKY